MSRKDPSTKNGASKREVFCTRVWRKDLGRYVYAHEYGLKAFHFFVDN